MPKLTKIYTKTGDDGTTSLGGRQKVPKDAPRVQAYGTVDELNASIGMAIAGGLSETLADALKAIQNELFNLGSDLCFTEEDKVRTSLPQIEERHITKLENMIDHLNREVGSLANFILPSGTLGAARLHLARTICRRAERAVVTLAREEPIGPHVLAYLNRLSDALFVMARYENFVHEVAETLWDSRA